MAENTVPHPLCIYCGLPVPISDGREYTVFNNPAEGSYRFCHNMCVDRIVIAARAAADAADSYPQKKTNAAIRVSKSRAPRKELRKDDCA